jgi:hypothetical protein
MFVDGWRANCAVDPGHARVHRRHDGAPQDPPSASGERHARRSVSRHALGRVARLPADINPFAASPPTASPTSRAAADGAGLRRISWRAIRWSRRRMRRSNLPHD